MKKSKIRREAEAALPPELRETFNALVDEYAESCKRHFGQSFGNYKSFADLVRAGWRKQP